MKKILLIIAGLAMLTASAGAQELRNFNFGGARQIVSPEIAGDSTTFRLSADYATVVTLYGSWLPGYGDRIPMVKGEGGVWSVTIETPDPEIYTYNFFVDGVSVNDPQNYMVQRDGTRYLNMLLVPGERSENYFESSQRGTVSYTMRPARPSIPCSTCCMAAVATRRHGPQWDAQPRSSTT